MAIIRAILFAAVGLAVLGAAGFFALGQYSKSGSAPGLVDGALAPCPDSPNCVSSEAATVAEKKVAVLLPEYWDALPGVIAEMGGEVTQAGDDYIAAEFTSATMGFVDDLELRRTEGAVHVRSASRVGYSDAGVNAARVATLREAVFQSNPWVGHVS